MSKQREVRLAIRELMNREEYSHLSYGEILNAVYFGQFGFLNKTMKGGDNKSFSSYKSVLIRYIGSFIAHPKRVDLRIEKFKEDGQYSK